ncbi:MAG TPA: class I SAM-dependent methyltransferase [Salinimicrobium sp.]|nr:class I SAM-dependent methyltransferase [Salinimicrobium sp.]
MNPKKPNPDIFGMAIKDYFKRQQAENIIVHSPDFEDDVIPVSVLFRGYHEMPEIEKTALRHCFGRVLDVGCGAGSHSLYLQDEKKLDVTAIDISEGAIEICKLRGLKDARNAAFSEFKSENFDTILLLMNGTGIIGKLEDLNGFFQKIKKLLTLSGQVLIDSSDLKYLFDIDEDGGIWIDASQGYYGELQYRLSYKNQSSTLFDWLFLDFETLQLAALQNGFNCELLKEGEHYDYLARLTLKDVG